MSISVNATPGTVCQPSIDTDVQAAIWPRKCGQICADIATVAMMFQISPSQSAISWRSVANLRQLREVPTILRVSGAPQSRALGSAPVFARNQPVYDLI
ncbi:hypothetical protein [Rhodopseudomonas pseudopalustris]|uniref:hypothetical protein n=1 Tax=Rhodopseudomonas pseudopalustris TaxID=1513892 RepID=UPI001113EBE8|nr:hypothetical protein [Rhodopseudomonas pseudopalustris]